MSPEQLMDVLDCGNAQEAWQEMVAHFKARAVSERQIAFKLDADALDAQKQAAEHHNIAQDFDSLADAIRSASVTFQKSEKRA